jgi:DNA-binding transcriptional regulator GbsR (MarR family)
LVVQRIVQKVRDYQLETENKRERDNQNQMNDVGNRIQTQTKCETVVLTVLKEITENFERDDFVEFCGSIFN